MALYKYVDLNEKAILNLSDFYAIKYTIHAEKTPNTNYILQRFSNRFLTSDEILKEFEALQKNILLKLRDNENIGILIVDYNMIRFIECNYNSIDFKRTIFIFISDWCKQKMATIAYNAEIEEFEKHNKENIVMLSHYNGSGVECRVIDKEYEEVF